MYHCVVSLCFVFRLIWHYKTSLLIEKYVLGNLVSEKWHIYKYARVSYVLIKICPKEWHVGSDFYTLDTQWSTLLLWHENEKFMWVAQVASFTQSWLLKVILKVILLHIPSYNCLMFWTVKCRLHISKDKNLVCGPFEVWSKISHLQQVMEVRTCVLHCLDSLIIYWITEKWIIHQISLFWCIHC